MPLDDSSYINCYSQSLTWDEFVKYKQHESGIGNFHFIEKELQQFHDNFSNSKE
jgi:hypothetical protein